jgi:hypothetical protein
VNFRTQRFEEELAEVDLVDLVVGFAKPDQALAASHGVSAAFFLVDVTTERLSMR